MSERMNDVQSACKVALINNGYTLLNLQTKNEFAFTLQTKSQYAFSLHSYIYQKPTNTVNLLLFAKLVNHIYLVK